jgi:hypothetical protein
VRRVSGPAFASGATGLGWHHSAIASSAALGARLLALGLLQRALLLPPDPRRARTQRWARARARCPETPRGPDSASQKPRARTALRTSSRCAAARTRPLPARCRCAGCGCSCRCPGATARLQPTARAASHPPAASLLAGMDSTLTSGNFTVFAPTGALRLAVPHAARLRGAYYQPHASLLPPRRRCVRQAAGGHRRGPPEGQEAPLGDPGALRLGPTGRAGCVAPRWSETKPDVLTHHRSQSFHVAKGKTVSKWIVNGSGQARASVAAPATRHVPHTR